MALELYRKKRKFAVTPEPRGRKARGGGQRYVIQKHAATRLHYDLRLEIDGVMKSWAVTRGPSLVPGEKRLAVEVEDHPVEYNAFEGTIPKGEYGGGTVMIWDQGTWAAEQDAHYGLEKGHLDFTLHGEKLGGRWHLVRLRSRPGEKRHNWLLIKADDAFARTPEGIDILEERPDSVISGRTIAEIAAGKGRQRVWHSSKSVSENVKAGATRNAVQPSRKRKTAPDPLPDFVKPALATLRETPPHGTNWVHEIKFDGYRTQARLDHGKVQLLTRTGLNWAARFPNVASDVTRLDADTALIDGEIVIENEKGVADFSMLQTALKNGERGRFRYWVFDLLYLDGENLAPRPFRERKAALQQLLNRSGSLSSLRYSEHFTGDGTDVWTQACRMKLEGIISKRLDAPYRSGRTDGFVKIKCADAQEFVVGGYAPSTVMPKAIGALAVGVYRDGRLVYAGRVGTGYSRAVARDLWGRLHPLEMANPPFDQIPRTEARSRDLRWVEPEIVIEAQFRGWTGDGMVRQAAFRDVRDDKPPREVVREHPVLAKSDDPPRRVAAQAANAAARQSKSSRRQKPPEVRFTHPDRIYWADVGVTKRNLADYYTAVWDWMAPHLVGVPISLLRCPDGVDGTCFFQKHASAGLEDDRLRSVIDSKHRQVIAVEDLTGLMSLVQAGVLEVHVRGSTIDRLDLCRRIVFDIDPGDGIAWIDIVRAAREVRERLAAIDLDCFVKLSGGKGVHVVLPILPSGWETVKVFVQAFAQAMAADDPKRYVAQMTKSLRKGRIFIDYMRNSLEQTSVAAYSTRARAGAPVSVPVTWDELGRVKAASHYTVLNLGKRLASLKRDPWAEIGKIQQKLPDLATLRKRQ